MKISDCIKELQEILKEDGDLEVAVLTETDDGMFCETYDPIIDAIDVPADEYTDNMETICIIAWPHIFDDDDTEEETEKKLLKLLN